MCQLRAFDTGDGEDTCLLNFTQECGFFTQRGGNGNAQYHFVDVVCQVAGSRIQIELNFWLPFLLEYLRSVWRFE
ncbi:hypothetical protein D3C76_1832030 [compost metagenome]